MKKLFLFIPICVLTLTAFAQTKKEQLARNVYKAEHANQEQVH
jgi:hypothetical protein